MKRETESLLQRRFDEGETREVARMMSRDAQDAVRAGLPKDVVDRMRATSDAMLGSRLLGRAAECNRFAKGVAPEPPSVSAYAYEVAHSFRELLADEIVKRGLMKDDVPPDR